MGTKVKRGDTGYVRYGYGWKSCTVLEVDPGGFWRNARYIVRSTDYPYSATAPLITDARPSEFVKSTASWEKK